MNLNTLSVRIQSLAFGAITPFNALFATIRIHGYVITGTATGISTNLIYLSTVTVNTYINNLGEPIIKSIFSLLSRLKYTKRNQILTALPHFRDPINNDSFVRTCFGVTSNRRAQTLSQFDRLTSADVIYTVFVKRLGINLLMTICRKVNKLNK